MMEISTGRPVSPSRYPATRRASEALAFIRSRLNADGISPSFEEIRQHLGVSSKGRVHAILGMLEERGHIRRLPNRARSIVLLDEDAALTLGPQISQRIASVAKVSGLTPEAVVGLALDALARSARS